MQLLSRWAGDKVTAAASEASTVVSRNSVRLACIDSFVICSLRRLYIGCGDVIISAIFTFVARRHVVGTENIVIA